MSKPIVVVGSLNADLVTRLQRFPAPGETLTALEFQKFSGGKGANQAYAAGRDDTAATGMGVYQCGRVWPESDCHRRWCQRGGLSRRPICECRSVC